MGPSKSRSVEPTELVLRTKLVYPMNEIPPVADGGRIDAEIAAAKAHLSNLYLRKRTAKAACTEPPQCRQLARNHTLQSVPNELIAEILVLVAHTTSDPVHLCHINSKLRSIALSTHGVWQHLHFLSAKRPPATLAPSAWLARAGALPLSIMSTVLPDDDLNDALTLGASRLVNVDLQRTYFMLLSSHPVRTFPCLRRLTIANRRFCRTNTLIASFELFEDTPALVSATLHFPATRINLAQLCIPWAQLEELHLVVLDPLDTVLRILEECTELQSLHILVYTTGSTDFEHSLSFNHLRTLSMTVPMKEPTTAMLLSIFSDIALPSLEDMSLKISLDKQDDTAFWMARFLGGPQGAGSTLRMLSFTFADLVTSDDMWLICKQLHVLETLVIKAESSDCLRWLLQSLSDVEDRVLPKLQSFELWMHKQSDPCCYLQVDEFSRGRNQKYCRSNDAWEVAKSRRSYPACRVYRVAEIVHWRIWMRGIDMWTGSETYQLQNAYDGRVTHDDDESEIHSQV